MSYRDIENQFAKLTPEEQKEEIVEAIKRATPEQIAKLEVLFGIKDEASRGLR